MNDGETRPAGVAPADRLRANYGTKLAGQFGWVSGGRLVGALIQAVMLVLVARWAGPPGFGSVGIALSLVVVLQTATDLGLPTFVVRERATWPGNPAILKALKTNNWTSRSMAVILFATFAAVGFAMDPLFFQLLPLAVWAAVDRNTDTWLGVSLADGDAWINTLALLSRRAGSAVLLVGVYLTGVDPLLAYSLAVAVVGAVVNGFVHRCMRQRISSTENVPVRPILRESRSYWVNSVSMQLRNLDALIVGLLTGTVQVAFYAAASKVTVPLRILPTSLATVLVPAAARVGAGNLRILVKPVGIFLAVLTLIYASILASAPWTVPSALGQDFAGAVAPVQIVCGGLIFGAVASIFSAVLQGTGHGRIVARVAIATTTACLVGVLFGTMVAGAIGASIALATSFALQALMLTVALRNARREPSAQEMGGAAKTVLAVGEKKAP